jgi:hypothetical protein
MTPEGTHSHNTKANLKTRNLEVKKGNDEKKKLDTGKEAVIPRVHCDKNSKMST